MNRYYSQNDQIRLSDRDRAVAMRRLRHHHRRGRIDGMELEERTDAVRFARNRGDLRPVFADLDPAGPRYRGRGFHRGWFPLFPVIPILFVIAIAATATGHVPWVALGILAFLLLVVAPWRRRRWGRAYGC